MKTVEAISKIGRQIEILERPFNIPSYVYMNVGGGKLLKTIHVMKKIC